MGMGIGVTLGTAVPVVVAVDGPSEVEAPAGVLVASVSAGLLEALGPGSNTLAKWNRVGLRTPCVSRRQSPKIEPYQKR